MLRLIYGFLLSVVKRFDYCFSENGLVAFKDGVQIGQQVLYKGRFKSSQPDLDLTFNAPIATKVVCFSRLLKCLRSLYDKQSGTRSDCSYRSSLFWVYAVCFYTGFVSNVRQLFAADDFSRQHFQMQFFLGALRVNQYI